VVVAHSLGGGVGVELAAAHPDQVKGLLLLDATPVGWLEATHAVPADVPGAPDLAQGYALFTQPSANRERFDGLTAFRELAQVTSLDALPLVVDNAVHAREELGLPAAYAKRVTAAWDAGQRRFARLSSAGVYRVVPGGHFVHRDEPALVLDQVRDLVAQAS
jgi:pimeloyl-ACP methyl ester carboxylesterase